jgi:cobalt-zinc-cadmium resistance protein CzcA
VQQSQAMQVPIEQMMAKQPEVQFVFSKTGTAELASDPMPPNATDMFVILKPHNAWPDPGLSKADLIKRLEGELNTFPGNAYEITQPIQMRFNELIAGVRGDMAIKVFGDDFNAMNLTADKIASILRRTPGAADVKVEQTSGLPMLDIRVNRDAMSRVGVTAQDVQDIVTATLGGRTSGMIFEGIGASPSSSACPTRSVPTSPHWSRCRFRYRAGSSFRSPAWRTSGSWTDRTRSAARTANAAWWCRPMCAGAILPAWSRMLRPPSPGRFVCPPAAIWNGVASLKIWLPPAPAFSW